MANEGQLDLARGGQLQTERVFINPTRTRAADTGAAGFLAQLSQLSGTLGGALADRERRKVAERKQVDSEAAQLAVEYPEEYQRRLESGELKETDSKDFTKNYNGFAAQKAANDAAASMRTFDVSAVQDESETDEFIAAMRQEALSRNTSVGYQGAVAAALNTEETALRARRNEFLRGQQIEQTYLNFKATTADSISEAAASGRAPEISEIINRRIDIGVGNGLRLTRALEAVRDAAVDAVTRDPDLFDELVSTPLPQVGEDASLGSLYGSDLSIAQAREISRRRAEARAGIAAANQAATAQARSARRQAAREVADTGSVSEETQSLLMQVDPEFALKIPKLISDTEAATVAIDPAVRQLETNIILRLPGFGQAAIDAALETGDIPNLTTYDRLSQRASSAAQHGDLTMKPSFRRNFDTVTRTVTGLTAPLKVIGMDPLSGAPISAPLNAAAAVAVQESTARIEATFFDLAADLIADGTPEPEAFTQAAADARDLAALEFDAIAQRFGVGESAPDEFADPTAATRPRRIRPPDPQLQREAALVLSSAGTETLVRLGGIHAVAESVSGDNAARLEQSVRDALVAFTSQDGAVTPWAAQRFAEFVDANPEMEGMPFDQFLHALAFSAMGR